MEHTDHLLKEYIDKTLRNETLNQSYIFEGAKGSGRTELAMYMARYLLCRSEAKENRPCGNCHSCTLVESGNHPDLITVTHEKPNTVSVDDIREQVIESMDVRPYYGGRKIYIIPDAELMKKEGQNALLKTIEEPPPYALIILIAKNKELLLPTIRSRCVTLSFRAEPVFIPEDEALIGQFDRIDGLIAGTVPSDMASLMDTAKELSADYQEYLPEILTHIEMACRDALLVKSGIILTEKTGKGYIEKTSAISYEGIERILNAVKKARHDILINVAAETVMDCLLIEIRQAHSQTV